MEDLEEIHIEWVSPDGKMKQCYNVQTLIKIACKGGKNLCAANPTGDIGAERRKIISSTRYNSVVE